MIINLLNSYKNVNELLANEPNILLHFKFSITACNMYVVIICIFVYIKNAICWPQCHHTALHLILRIYFHCKNIFYHLFCECQIQPFGNLLSLTCMYLR